MADDIDSGAQPWNMAVMHCTSGATFRQSSTQGVYFRREVNIGRIALNDDVLVQMARRMRRTASAL